MCAIEKLPGEIISSKMFLPRLLEEKKTSSEGEYLRSLSDSTAERETEEEKELWAERRSISLGEADGEEKTKTMHKDVSPTATSDQECLGEHFSSLATLSNFLKRKEKEKKEEKSKQLSVHSPADFALQEVTSHHI